MHELVSTISWTSKPQVYDKQLWSILFWDLKEKAVPPEVQILFTN